MVTGQMFPVVYNTRHRTICDITSAGDQWQCRYSRELIWVSIRGRVPTTGNTDSLLPVSTAHQFFSEYNRNIYAKKVHLGTHCVDCLV